MDGSQKMRGVLAPRTAHDIAGGRSGARRWRAPLVAVVAMLALVFSVLVPASAASANSQYPDVQWTKTSSSKATGALPGNFASLPGATVTVSSSAQPLSTQNTGISLATVHTNGTNTDSCIRGKARYQINTCEAFTYTVNLKTPLIDPIVPFEASAGVYTSWSESVTRGCIIGWYDMSLAAINGSSTDGSEFTTVDEPGGWWSHTGPTTWSVPQSKINSNSCTSMNANNMATVRLHGLISSYSFTVYYQNSIVIPWSSTLCPLLTAPAGVFAAGILLPTADLAITKTAPANVGPNGTITWNLSVSNAGPEPSHGFIVKDAVPSNVTSPTIVNAPSGCTITGNDLTCQFAPPGCSVSQNPTESSVADLSCANPGSAHQSVLGAGQALPTITLSGTAPVAAGATVTNTATVVGADADSNLKNNSSTAVTTVVQSAKLNIAKQAALAPGATGKVGDQVNYTFTATNTGNQTLTNVSVQDQLAGMSVLTYQWPGTPGVLVPGQSVTATAKYTIAQKDVDSGSVNNVATATSVAPNGAPVNAGPAQATVPLSVAPELTLTKNAALAAGSSGVAGDKVQYSFTVINTGRVPLTSVSISDPLDGVGPIEFGAWPGEPGHLAPGESVTATATYALTADDVARGRVENTAWAHGTGDGKDVKGGSNTVTVQVPQRLAASGEPQLIETLARTGQDALPIGLGALGLLLLGGLVLLARRRPQES